MILFLNDATAYSDFVKVGNFARELQRVVAGSYASTEGVLYPPIRSYPPTMTTATLHPVDCRGRVRSLLISLPARCIVE